jgi:hypothetical protein
MMTIMVANDGLPSKVTTDYFLHAHVPAGTLGSFDTVGKWQVYVQREHVDEAWTTVAAMVAAGQLGPAAKVSTAKENPNSSSSPDVHVVIVYAADWRDVADLRRILRALRGAGLAQGWVHFKRDRETYAGAYVNRGRRGVSVWNAAPGGDEISTKWVTGKRVVVTDENVAEVVAQIQALDGAAS